MLNIAKYHTRILGVHNVTRCIFSRQSFYTNTKINSMPLLRCKRNNNSLKKYCSLLSRKRPLKEIDIITRNYASKGSNKYNKIVGSWLLTCGGMVFIAVALGGITRLTESGLSMVTWKLLGEKIPFNEAQWLLEFERYKQFPEYKIINHNMTLEEFKRIWWMEYLHRMWGRLIGAVFIIPATYFWFKKGVLKNGMKTRIIALGSLIGLQGLMGWYMVKSGLEDRFVEPSDVPRVSQYRLAAHLGLALLLYTGFLWNALDHLIPAQKPINLCNATITDNAQKAIKKLKRLIYSTKGLIFFTALSGAFVAGMDAGLIYNTFPKMADKWVPDDIFAISPILRNFTENPTTIQFDHRILGISTIVLITCLALMSRKYKLPGRGKQAMIAVFCAGYLQVLLGISTLLSHVPVTLAAFHQSGSLILLSSIIWLCHELRYIGKLVK